MIRRLLDRFFRRPPAPLDPEDLRALTLALQAGSSSVVYPRGFPLAVENLQATLWNVTFNEADIDIWTPSAVGQSFRNRKTGGTYIVVKGVKGKTPYTFSLRNLPKIIRAERHWVRGVEYTSLEKGGESFWRSVDDFRAKFERLASSGQTR